MTAQPAPLQVVELIHAGRQYGVPTLTLHERASQEPSPEIGGIFIEDVVASSAIMALSDRSTHEQILAAYGKDIKALAQRRKEADGFMLQILRCAMVRFHIHDEKRRIEAEMLQRLLEPLGISPQIAFTAERSAMEPAQLVVWLKAEFSSEADRMARRIATTLHYLADHNVVGLVQWHKADVCKFHYFSWRVEHSETTTRERTGDVMDWNTLTTSVTNVARLERTRHTHHLVNAGVHIAGDYKRPIPDRINELLGSAPAWLKPHLVIIDGTETLSEEVTTTADESTHVKTNSVMRYDPAVAFGPLVFAGWNDADVAVVEDDGPSATTILYCFIAFVTVFISLICWAVSSRNKADAARHSAYVQSEKAAAREEFTTKVGEPIRLPVNYALVFEGQGIRPDSVRFATQVHGIQDQPLPIVWTDFFIPGKSGENLYGDIDLRSLNLPFILHVHFVQKHGWIRYAVEEVK